MLRSRYKSGRVTGEKWKTYSFVLTVGRIEITLISIVNQKYLPFPAQLEAY
jgi:hypothetical protein